ncbi:helix-turn-helix domain-containing protein [Dysgonomonas macrotermitis]|uniref:AraC-type DNA-binding protein n=1 Tax=Dysgonomonas macrotermitis TaxID=1346286 RepID=A0A1M4WIU6_9BACT|nr:helix-turn-helix domain-containing protein [Dysgonomonas macrotermitis]SHE81070.1 AraC-type DNA-binding protein [Dysgonomonas macrotermitis]
MKKNVYILYSFNILLLISSFIIISCKKNNRNSASDNIEKLEALRKLSSSDFFSPAGLKQMQLLRDLAKEQNNDLYTGYAYHYLSTYYLNDNDQDSALYNGLEAIKYFSKAKEPDLLLEAKIEVIRWEANFGNTQIAVEEVNNLFKEFHNSNLSDFQIHRLQAYIYIILDNPYKAMENFNKMLELKAKHNMDLGVSSKFIFHKVAETAMNAGEYNLSLRYCDSAKYYLKKYPDNNNATLTTLVDIIRLSDYVNLDQMDKADEIIEKYSTPAFISHDKFARYIRFVFTDYYLKRKEYDEALNAINVSIEEFKETKYRFYYKQALMKKIAILEAMKENKSAYELRNAIDSYKDSLYRENSIQELNNLYNNYEVEKNHQLKKESNHQLKNNLFIIVLMLTVVVLLINVGIIFTINYIKIRRKNSQILSQYNEIDEYRKKVLEQTPSKNILEEDPTTSLFEKIESYLYSTQKFLDPTLSREILSSELETNREYLTKAIKNNVQKSFMEYIYDLRLEHARHLLSYNTNIPVQKIYELSGFTNKSTFYRLFKQKYTLTPQDFRNHILQKMTDK